MLEKKTIEQLEEMSPIELEDVIFDSINCGVLDREYLSKLLSYGADLNIQHKKYHTFVNELGPMQDGSFLHFTVYHNLLDMSRILLELGANVNIAKNSGWTPLHYAVERVSPEMIRLLLEFGANVEAKGWYNRSPFLRSNIFTRYNNYDVIVCMKLLIAAGADINAKTDYGTNTLHNFVRTTHAKEVVKFLIESGADITAKDSRGKTPWDLASDIIKEQVPELNPHA